jgi:hypothetical protein
MRVTVFYNSGLEILQIQWPLARRKIEMHRGRLAGIGARSAMRLNADDQVLMQLE